METKEIDYKGLSPRELADAIVALLHEKGAGDIRLFHVEEATNITDFYVIATGRSATHIKALADEVVYQMENGNLNAEHVEGREAGSWILLDYSSVIVHIFSREEREYYKLERLLPEGTQIDLTEFLHTLEKKATEI